MTRKDFFASMDSLSVSLYSVGKALNGKNNDEFKSAWTIYEEKAKALLAPFNVEVNSLILQKLVTRTTSYKKDNETGEHVFKVSGSTIKKFIKEELLPKGWEDMVEKAKKGGKKSKEEKQEEFAKTTFGMSLTELKEAIAKAKEGQEIAA